KNNNILEPTMEKTETGELRYKSWKKYTFINGQRIKGIKIPFTKLQHVLEIRNEEIYDMKNSDKVEIEEMQVSLIETCSRYLAENPRFKNVSYTPEDVADMFIRSKDREELLIFGRERIVEAFKTCKKRK
ncbi:MAG: putative primase/helicase, partial [Euryarchaeota archaeon]|nr:putative primase/helicase [Euryarchaeota archaeon]